MTKFRPLLFTLIAFLVVGYGLTLLPQQVRAINATSTTIIPPRFTLYADPSDRVADSVKVVNNGNADATYHVVVEDFSASGDQGFVSLQSNKAAPTTNFSLANWISVEPSEFTIPAGGTQVVQFTISVPAKAEAGGHYASVLVENGASTATSGGAAVVNSIGSLILLQVSGNITEKLSVTSFNAENSYSQYGPVNLDLLETNTGNVHSATAGTVVITNIFGKKVAEIPITPENVLPGSSRQVVVTWNTKNLVGRYTATLVGTYGQSHQTISASTTFIVFPLTIVYILIGIIVVIFLLITQRRRLKKLINNLTSD